MPKGSDLDDKVSRQVEAAVTEADLVLFAVDSIIGVTDDDAALAAWLRKSGRSVMVVSNKVDSDKREADRWEFLSLGLGEPYPVSALHGRNNSRPCEKNRRRARSSSLPVECSSNWATDTGVLRSPGRPRSNRA